MFGDLLRARMGDVPMEVGFLACATLPALGFVLGLISFARIGLSGGRLTGRGFAVIGAVVPLMLGLLFLGIWLAEARKRASFYRMQCGANLSGIGKAMLIYANDYGDKFPVAGGEGTVWGAGLNDWKARSRDEAFGFDPNGAGGAATVSSSLYLLIRYAEVAPKSFVCKGDRQTRQFKPERYGVSREKLTSLWDFGPNPATHCSYAYHMPYGRYALTTSSVPGLAVAADRNPWIDGPRQKAGDFSLFKPDIKPFYGTTESARRGNARAHNKYNGQNVLFLDSHVEFAQRPFCAKWDDNIYTSWDGDDKACGLPPKPYESKPAHEFDSLLVNDPPLGR